MCLGTGSDSPLLNSCLPWPQLKDSALSSTGALHLYSLWSVTSTQILQIPPHQSLNPKVLVGSRSQGWPVLLPLPTSLPILLISVYSPPTWAPALHSGLGPCQSCLDDSGWILWNPGFCSNFRPHWSHFMEDILPWSLNPKMPAPLFPPVTSTSASSWHKDPLQGHRDLHMFDVYSLQEPPVSTGGQEPSLSCSFLFFQGLHLWSARWAWVCRLCPCSLFRGVGIIIEPTSPGVVVWIQLVEWESELLCSPFSLKERCKKMVSCHVALLGWSLLT